MKRVEAEAKYRFDEETEAGLREIGFLNGGPGHENMYHTADMRAFIHANEGGWRFSISAFGASAEDAAADAYRAVDAIRKADAYLKEGK